MWKIGVLPRLFLHRNFKSRYYMIYPHSLVRLFSAQFALLRDGPSTTLRREFPFNVEDTCFL